MSENKLNENVAITEDVIKARREARGRKILENAKSRLAKLSNGQVKKSEDVKNQEEEQKLGSYDDWQTNEQKKTDKLLKDFIKNVQEQSLKEQDTFPDPEIESELEFGPKLNFNIANFQQQGQHQQEFNQNFLWQQPSNTNSSPLFGLSNDFAEQMMFGSLNQPNNQKPNPENLNNSNTKLNIIIKNKLHLIVISIFTYIVSRNENFTTLSVFLPLLIWELTEAFVLKTANTSNDFIFNILLLLAGLSPKSTNIIHKIVGILNKIFKDVGVFVFFFVICHIIAINFF